MGKQSGLAAAILCLVTACTHLQKTAKSTAPQNTNDEPLRFAVSFPETVRRQPVTGRVLLFLSRSERGEPRHADSFSNLQPVYAIDATNFYPGDLLVFSPRKFKAPDALAFPGPLDSLEAGTYHAQAVIDLDNTERDFNRGPGNLYSDPLECNLRGSKGGTFELIASHVVSNTPPRDTDWVKLVEVPSRLLTDFHKREIKLRAAVILPSTYHSTNEQKYPVRYIVPGFGGRHTSAWDWINSESGKKWQKGDVPLQMLSVVLDPDVPLGHSVFANSQNNGPAGNALVQELIPEIERRFRAIAQPWARFVTGHSSGGWSSVWLQVTYPDFFGSCWSTAPDPVDFRAFQTMNIYEDRNGHWTREGIPRPLSRTRDKVMLTFPQLDLYEYVIGYGSQLDSFDAVFSPRGEDGKPRRLIHKLTGAIDRDVAEHWKRYDIRRVLEANWSSLGPKLKGKLHVIAAAWDTYYLEPAAELLRDFLKTTDYGGYVEILPGSHGSVITDSVRDRIEREMADKFAENEKANRTPSEQQASPVR
jgi:hypothetical protein